MVLASFLIVTFTVHSPLFTIFILKMNFNHRGLNNIFRLSCGIYSEVETYDRIDIMVNNAGIGMRSPAEVMADEMWNKVLDINLDVC